MKAIRQEKIKGHDIISKVKGLRKQTTRTYLTHPRCGGKVTAQEVIYQSQENTETPTVIQRQLQDFIEITFAETELSAILGFPLEVCRHHLYA